MMLDTAHLGPSLALRATGLLREFNVAGILTAADVHVAARLGAMFGEANDAVLLATALTVRSTRYGSVVLDLATVADTTSADDDEATDSAGVPEIAIADLPWPASDTWSELVAASSLTGTALRMSGSRLWLNKYWQQEEDVARELLSRSASLPDDLDLRQLCAGLDRLFVAGSDDDQRAAAAVCAVSRVSVLAGGPGTGKTTTVSRLLALLREQHPQWRVALAAPTGKAAARLEEAVRSSAARLSATDRERVGELSATTLHRMLGWTPGARSRFRHHRTNRLPVEVVVVDESSMVSLTLMARLLEALRPETRLILVGDPDQLASVEAGAVLGDLVDRSTVGVRTARMSAVLRELLPTTSASETAETRESHVRDGISALSSNRRFPADSGIAALAEAVRDGNADAALHVLASGAPDLQFIEAADDSFVAPDLLRSTRQDVQTCGRALHQAAEHGDASAALDALEAHRILCAHRLGPRGVAHWSGLAARWIAEENPVTARPDGRYPGEPLLVTANDYAIGLYNGDTGVVIAEPASGELLAVFGRGGEPIRVPLARLGGVRPVHAMTIHRSQGSQYSRVTILLPSARSPLGTRETLYTAITRATSHVRLIGSSASLVAAVERPAARATGLRERLKS